MSKKHFEALAKMVAELRGRIPEDARVTVAAELARVCESTNPRFDRGRFMEACSKQGAAKLERALQGSKA